MEEYEEMQYEYCEDQFTFDEYTSNDNDFFWLPEDPERHSSSSLSVSTSDASTQTYVSKKQRFRWDQQRLKAKKRWLETKYIELLHAINNHEE